MKKIKLMSLFVVALFLSSVLGASMSSTNLNYRTNQDGTNVAIVYSTGGLGDLSFNDAAKRGLDAAVAEHGISYAEACESDCTVDDINSNIESFAADGTYDLIIAIGFSSASGVNASAIDHPNQNFMIIDEVVDQPNVNSITFKEHEGSFLVGAMAAMVTESDHIAFLGGLDIPLINRFLAGYADGATEINPDIEVSATYAPDPNNPFNDQAGGKQVGETFIENGADIIFAAAGGTGIGVITAVEEHNENAGETEVYAIGVDSDQDHISEGNVLTSMIKKVDVAVQGDIDKLVDGDWSAGQTNLGLAEDGVDISPMNYTMSEANATFEGDTTRWEKVQELKQSVIDGDITVESDPDNIDRINPEEEEAEQIPLPSLPIIFAVISSVAIARVIRRNNY